MKDNLKNNHNMLFRLFLSTLYISAFTFGGGYVIVSLMKKKFVDDYHWIDEMKCWILSLLPSLLLVLLQSMVRLL